MHVGCVMRVRLAGLFVVGGLFAISFFLPVLAIPLSDQPFETRLKEEISNRTGGGKVTTIGGASSRGQPVAVFMVDGLGAFYESASPSRGWAFVAWCANPVLWGGCLFLVAGWSRAAALAGSVALILGSAMIFAIVGGDPAADVQWSIADYREGYWLWLGSMLVMVLAALVGQRFGGRQSPSADPARISASRSF